MHRVGRYPLRSRALQLCLGGGKILPCTLGETEAVAEVGGEAGIDADAIRPATRLQLHVMEAEERCRVEGFHVGAFEVEGMRRAERAIEAQPRGGDPELAFAVIAEVRVPRHEADGRLAIER